MTLRIKGLLYVGIAILLLTLLYLLSISGLVQSSEPSILHLSWFFIVGISFIVMVLVFLDYVILKHLRYIAANMVLIAGSQDFSLRIPIKGKDELSELKLKFNHMMDSLEDAQVMIKHQSLHDPLTGLPNRIYLFEDLQQAINTARKNQTCVAILFIDLDNFKQVNDTLGHNMGDQLLIQFTHRLKRCLSSGDMVSRLGGDEFCYVTSYRNGTNHLTHLIQRIENVIDEPFSLEENVATISTSIGISVYPQDGSDPQTLLRKADMSMFRMKQAGKSSHQFYTKDMEIQFSRRTMIEQHLKKAMQENEFYIEYQPKFNITTGKLTGVETLLRWENAILGQIPPAEFIPIAESMGLISSIGEWVIRKACQQHSAWKSQSHREVSIAVNLSRIQLVQLDLVPLIANILAEEEINPQFLELEINDSAAMKDVEGTLHLFKALQQMGLLLAIDNFGAGHTSLAYLKRFPLHTLKIDASLIKSLTLNKEDTMLVKAIIELGHNLNLTVIANGVETPSQLSALLQLRCDEAQGFHTGKALSPIQLEEFISGDKPLPQF